MLILGIESSCDETAASLVKDGREVLSDVIYSQAEIHSKYGGVVPEIASRRHIEKVLYVIDKALADANVTKDDIDAIAVTCGPGLVGALLVGVSAAKSLAVAWDKPLIPVNHIKGHISANYVAFKELEPPFICLVASGGHSHIVHVKDYTDMEVLGATRDDAAGEAFDKVARVIGLGYPGGPKVDAAAKEGNPEAFSFPRAKTGDDFSFSGLKTAVINTVHKMEQKGEEIPVNDIAASFQQAVVEVLVANTINQAEKVGTDIICLAGGVASNSLLISEFEKAAKDKKLTLYYPPLRFCTDNAVMIASAGYFAYKAGDVASSDLNAYPALTLE
ncbi:MAG: tRNA (adenosine(37)-N6)-threonylcarbamoyltransferase complex transferase subunit TsaD [Clostridia bacterium]|nr:tRNA (adenosine(37)-N6)-threonylcarbamoyltransferase complex transferase subunit TsaD [Clostridia bacterium]